MALSDKSIADLYKVVADRSGVRKFQEFVDADISNINQNPDYVAFTETAIGSELNSKLLKIRDISLETANEIENLLKTTDSFLDRQKTLNSMQLGQEPGELTNFYSSAADENLARYGSKDYTTYVTLPGGNSVPSSATWKR